MTNDQPSLHSLSVQMAELRGQVAGLTQVVGTRIDTIERDLKREATEADTDHDRLYGKLREHADDIAELKTRWRSMKAMAAGIGIGSGLASGSVVGIILRGLGG